VLVLVAAAAAFPVYSGGNGPAIPGVMDQTLWPVCRPESWAIVALSPKCVKESLRIPDVFLFISENNLLFRCR
jgi:hypothetical protein